MTAVESHLKNVEVTQRDLVKRENSTSNSGDGDGPILENIDNCAAPRVGIVVDQANPFAGGGSVARNVRRDDWQAARQRLENCVGIALALGRHYQSVGASQNIGQFLSTGYVAKESNWQSAGQALEARALRSVPDYDQLCIDAGRELR